MLFNSFPFLFAFLPVVVIGYYALAMRAGMTFAWGFLILASLFFYAWWNPKFLPLLLLSISFNFVVGRILGHAELPELAKKAVLAFGLAGNLLFLGYFKYVN